MPDPASSARFSRQTRLAAFGRAAQARLAAADVLIVGAGGLGAPVVQYLAAAGVGRLTVVDDDRVEESNLNRQVLFGEADLGQHKATLAARWVTTHHPAVEARAEVARLGVMNGRRLIEGRDLVVDCTDGLPSKYLVQDLAVAARVALVHGAITAFDGRVMSIAAGGGPCLRCLFPTLPPAGSVPTCQQVGVLGASVGVVGSLMAQQALMLFADEPPPTGVMTSVDLRGLRLHRMGVPADPGCPACGTAPSVDGSDPDDYRPARA